MLALADEGGKTYGITLADGGQSDNLGLWTAYHATRNELLSQDRRGAVHIVLDSAIEPATPFVETKVGNWEASMGERVAGNGQPLLRMARLNAEPFLRLRKQEELKEKNGLYQPFFVRAGDVLGGISSSLANDRQRAEDLVTLGREAMARVYNERGLKQALDECFAQQPPAPPVLGPVPESPSSGSH